MANILKLQPENRRQLVNYLQIEFSGHLLCEKWTNPDIDVTEMQADIQRVIKALSSTLANEIRAEDITVADSINKRMVTLLENAIHYLLSENWTKKKYFLNKNAPDKYNTLILHADLLQIIDLLNS